MTEHFRRETSPQVKAGLRADLVRHARLVWRLMRDARVAPAAKLIIPGLMVAYLLWPVDLLPDWFLLLGQMDDLALLALAAKLFVDLCPPDIVQQHRNDLAGNREIPRSDPGSGQVIDGEYRIIE